MYIYKDTKKNYPTFAARNSVCYKSFVSLSYMEYNFNIKGVERFMILTLVVWKERQTENYHM